MQRIRWIAWIAGIVVLLALALQNNVSTQVQLFWMQRRLPLSVMLIVALGLGFLFGALVTVMTLRRRDRPDRSSAARAKVSSSNPASEFAPLPTDSGSHPKPLGQ